MIPLGMIRMGMIRTGLIATAAALTIMLGAWIWLASALPEDATNVPVHWGVSGAPDRFASRDEAIGLFGLLPAIGLLSALLFCAIPYIEPLKENLLKGRRAYLAAWIGVQALFAFIALGVAYATLADAADGSDKFMQVVFVRAVFACVGVLFIILGDALPKTRPNFFLGVRTPWTLTSDLSWEKTHRFAGRMLVLVGLWQIIAPFVVKGAALAFAIAAPVLATALAAFVYSYVIWRGDPNRRRPAQEA